ncbi:glycoside hydrolase family 38 C-terminal domain-containing protein [Paenibacillus qinlingensis]|uniref:Alpha-mannosidase n=1 Tax=Paenibacillus qinlingensis TaxID=1837343 RepID=A0ABU1NSG3_9BACL|nr:glycoside hydrolase family 38 C-terminal domain-containing protein [Paenibacillus qinlingensis]MDR6550411.1 alpha-mannosidase [Paenibacillus qinlingensis]
MRKFHLLSNAHLDPVWQWEWEEGAAAAVSTFRAAAAFCDEYEGYIFNHNEALLYKWIEEYEPSLFIKIQGLVQAGKWHIMGGWYLQPDCNMPSGESMVRQILLGKTYFKDKFGVMPTTAINFDSFGHSRGLVQIMRKASFDSYLFMRPEDRVAGPAQEFVWVGFDGSEVLAHQIQDGYNTLLGQAHIKVEERINKQTTQDVELVLWGVGNHGGGPSRLDLNHIGALIESTQGKDEVLHSTPEAYFADLAKNADALPRHRDDLNPRFVGCYTSMIRIKQKHRQLENELYQTEKMLSSAGIQGYLRYPKEELNDALHDLMLAEFHDILPGTSIQPAEEASLRLIDHGLEIVSRLKARAFFALSSGQRVAAEGEYPILVYNPHPYPVRGVFECEFMLADQNWKNEFSMPVVFQDGVRLPSQAEKEHSNINLDWRKRVVFEAQLTPSSMNRFDCRIELLPSKPKPQVELVDGDIHFRSHDLHVVINTQTGLIDQYVAGGIAYLKEGAFQPLVIADNGDPWCMDTDGFEKVKGAFRLMLPEEGTAFSGITEGILPSVRVIEDGEVRTVIESLLMYDHSAVVITYKLPKQGTEIEVHVRVYWQEKDSMLKLSIPTVLEESRYVGQTVYGVQSLATDGTEVVAQKWTALMSETDAVTLINDGIYGSDSSNGVMRPSLLRGAAYTAHPILERPLMPTDRFSPRIDQGERIFRFWLNAGSRVERLAHIDREALQRNEKPYALSFFPHGEGHLPAAAIQLEDNVIQLTGFKRAENSKDSYILRFFEPTGLARSTVVKIPSMDIELPIGFNGFELKTYKLDKQTRTLLECELMEG